MAEEVKAVLKDVLGEQPSSVLKSACYTLITLVESSSPEGGLLIYMFGLRLGERIAKKLTKLSDPLSGLKAVIESLGVAKDVKFEGMGEEIMVRVESSEEVKKTRGCNFMRGFLAGFLSNHLGRPVYVEQVSCCSNFDCYLVVKPLEIPETNSTRQAIIEYLRVNPGAHLRQMSRDLGLSLGTLRWHLSVLERVGLVWERRKGNMTEFYLADLQ